MIESITCFKNWSITDRSYESISDSFAIFTIFLKCCYIFNYYLSNGHPLQLTYNSIGFEMEL